MTNDDLALYTPTGASHATAQPEGLGTVGRPASETIARRDWPRVMPLRARFQAVALRHAMPPALLAAIASRESHVGALLDANGFGDGGNAFGIMQVDRRFHQIQGLGDPASEAHVEQATQILAGFQATVTQRHADWPRIRQLQGAVAAYNVGPDNVQTLDGMDVGTTHDDYSNDVWARALFFAAQWNA